MGPSATGSDVDDRGPIEYLELDDLAPRVLVLVDRRRDTRLVATVLEVMLEARGLAVEVADAAHGPPPPADYDGIVIGVAAGVRRDRAVWSYLASFATNLRELPAAVFVVGTDRRCALAVRDVMKRRPQSIAVFATPPWPWRPLRIDRDRAARLVDDLVLALAVRG